MAFRKGGDEASEAASKKSGSNFARTHWFSLEDGAEQVVRYLMDHSEILFVDQHASVPTKNKPKGFEGNWPKSMPAVCRYDAAFTQDDDGNEKPKSEWTHPDCFVCDNKIENAWGKPIKAAVRDWTLAVLREEVVGTKAMVESGQIEERQVGKRIGFKDQTREVTYTDKDGKEQTRVEIAVVVVNMAPSNYFDGLGVLAATYKGQGLPGICDRDIVVRRKGEGTDTEYYHVGLDPTPALGPGTEKWAKYTKAIEEQGLDLEALINDRASDEYYGRFFDPSYVQKDGEGSSSSQASGDSSGSDEKASGKDDSGPDEERLRAMRERVRKGSSAAMADVD